jgi:hypothetical protein
VAPNFERVATGFAQLNGGAMFGNADHPSSSDGFMPHGMCYLWRPDVLTLHIGADLPIALAYFTISFTLLQIESAPGAGTTFRLIFPVLSAPHTPGEPIAVPLRALQPSRILVVDDDPIILKSLSDMFERDGHFVEVADGGQRGIDAFRAAQTPVVLLTGWGHRMLAEDGVPVNVDRVLGKPPKLANLREVLAELAEVVPA